MEGLQDLLRATERKLEAERTGIDTSSFEYEECTCRIL
jgi:hypothetical protein